MPKLVASGRWPVPAAGRTAKAPAAESTSVVAASNSAQAVVDAPDIDSAVPMLGLAAVPAARSPEAVPIGHPLPPPVPPVPSFAPSQSPQSAQHSRWLTVVASGTASPPAPASAS